MKGLSGGPGRRPWLVFVVALFALVALAMAATSGAGSKSGGRGDKKVVLVPPGEQKGPAANGPKARQSRPTNLTKAAQPKAGPPAEVVDPVDLKLLVITVGGSEDDFEYEYLKSSLDQIGIPYDVLNARVEELTSGRLSDSPTHGKYQGIILTTGNLWYSDSGALVSAFSDAEWQTLYAYERSFGVRQVTAYTAPLWGPDGNGTGAYGLRYVGEVDTTTTPLGTTLTSQGRTVFPYLNAATPVTFRNAYLYKATLDTCDVTTSCASLTPLLTTAEAGHVVAIVKKYTDGRENLAVTAASNPNLLHSLLLSYGVVNWVTRGLFLGERHVNLNVQVDDMLLDDDIWDPAAHSDQTGLTYRLTGADFTAARAWQSAKRGSSSLLKGLTLEHAYNAEGASGIYVPDTLTPVIRSGQSSAFAWVNHGWEHLDLDTATLDAATREIQANINAAAKRELGLSQFSKDAYVQADIGGLGNPAFLQAAVNVGVKYLISDTSRPGGNNPSPNAGTYSTYQPGILVIPRHPTNLFYNLATPDQWVDEYNWYYWKGSPSDSQWKYWDDEQTYEQILQHESDWLLGYMLRWDIDPWMFHQANLAQYAAEKSLLSDLLDLTFQRYLSHYNLPVRNLTEHDVGILMAQRMAYNGSGATASMTPCVGGQRQVTISVTTSAAVPVTGVTVGKAEVYGGQPISFVSVSAGSPKTVKASCS